MEEQYTRLEDYLDGQLSEAERVQLETELLSNEKLASDLSLLQETRRVLGDHFTNRKADIALEANLQDIQSDFFLAEDTATPQAAPKKPKSAKIVSLVTRIAAIAAVMVGLVWGAFHFMNPDPPVYADYAQHTTADFSEMGTGELLLSDAATAFNQKRYQRAAILLEQAVVLNPDRPDLKLYLGIAQLETGLHTNAKQTFEQLRSNADYQK